MSRLADLLYRASMLAETVPTLFRSFGQTVHKSFAFFDQLLTDSIGLIRADWEVYPVDAFNNLIYDFS